MSGTSWAGASSRYHVHVPVNAVLLPPAQETEAIAKSEFRKEFLTGPDGNTLGLPGDPPSRRPVVLEQMHTQLAVPAIPSDPSPLASELDAIADPGRRRILLLTGSYEEAKLAVRVLESIPEWAGRVCRLVPDDADLDHTWQLAGTGLNAAQHARGAAPLLRSRTRCRRRGPGDRRDALRTVLPGRGQDAMTCPADERTCRR